MNLMFSKLCRKFAGPHLCGDALDIDPVHNHILTGSWRKNHVLQVMHISKKANT